MTNEELVMRIKDGNKELMSELYTQNIRLIQIIVRRLCTDINDYEDAMQDAYFGLAAAVETYSTDKGTKFITHATYHIRQAIRRGQSTLQHIPEHIKFRGAHIRRIQNELYIQFERTPTAEEISNKTGLTVKQIKHTLYATMPTQSIYATIGTEDLTLVDIIQDERADIETAIIAIDAHKALFNAIRTLPKLEAQSVHLIYLKNMTITKTAEIMDIPINEVKNIIRRALNKLQAILKVKNDYI